MSGELSRSSKYRSTPAAPVDAGERERLTQQLNDAYTRGALEQDDYQQRMDRLYQASSLGELVPVVEGLAPAPTYAEPEIVQQSGGQPGDVGDAPTGNRFSLAMLAVIGGSVAVLVVLIFLLMFLL